jgi:lysozyme
VRNYMDKLIKLVKHFEGCRLTAYQDAVGVWTIGWGETEGVKRGMKISQEMADALLEKRLDTLYVQVDSMIPGLRPQSEIYALCSFAYNLGLGALKRSTLLKRVKDNASEDEVTRQFMRWTKAGGKELPGLVRRRKAEAHLFCTGELRFFE